MQKIWHALDTGRFVSVQFVTKSGEVRTISGRTGVKKYVKGTGSRSEKVREEYLLLSIKGDDGRHFTEFRNIRKDRILAVKFDGKTMASNDASDYCKFL